MCHRGSYTPRLCLTTHYHVNLKESCQFSSCFKAKLCKSKLCKTRLLTYKFGIFLIWCVVYSCFGRISFASYFLLCWHTLCYQDMMPDCNNMPVKFICEDVLDSAWLFWPLNMGYNCCPETSVTNQPTLRSNTEEKRAQVQCNKSLESHIYDFCPSMYMCAMHL